MIVFVLGLAFAQSDPSPERNIRAIPGGGQSAWDTSVKRVLLDTYDADRSGEIDTQSELDEVACGVWAAVDDGVRQGWDSSFYVVYGVDPDLTWVGTLGIAESYRAPLGRELLKCGIGKSRRQGHGTPPIQIPGNDLPAEAPGSPAAKIRAIPGPSGTGAWDEQVKQILVAAYDANGSSEVDTTSEVDQIPCTTWKAMDEGVQASEYAGKLDTIYGYHPEYIWVGMLGIAESQRATAHAKLVSCGLAEGAEKPEPVEPTSGSAAERIRLIPPPTGTSEWDAVVARILVAAYDSDGSLEVDTQGELDQIPCATWKAIDDGVMKSEYEGRLDQIYGFAPEFIWVGGLGIAESLRYPAHNALVGCGIGVGGLAPMPVVPAEAPAEVPPPGAAPAAIRALSSPASSEWDRGVSRILVGAYDSNGSGSVDTAAEVAAIPCETWKALDQAVFHSQYENRLKVIYGFDPDLIWVDALGIDESQRATAFAAVEACGY